MKVKYTFPVEDLRGKSGGNSGLVASYWRGIATMRTFVVPNNPRSTDQLLVRQFMTSAAKAWTNVTPTEHEMWGYYAAKTPVKIMGKNIILTGMDMFIRTNFFAQLAGQAIDLIAPEHYPIDWSISDISNVAVDLDNDTLAMTITHDGNPAHGNYICAYMTPLLSSQNITIQEGMYKLISGATPANLSCRPQVAAITPVTFSNLRTVPNITQYFGLKIIPFNDFFVPGTPFYKKVIATEA